MKGAPSSPHRSLSDPLADYYNRHADAVLRHVIEGRCVLLHGPFGAGKSEVLRQVQHRIDGKPALQCVLVNIEDESVMLRPRDLLFRIAGLLEPGRFEPAMLEDARADSLLRNWLLDRLNTHTSSLVLLLDHVERLGRSREIYQLLRALYQDVEAGRGDDGASDRPFFAFVIASHQMLAQPLLAPASPIANILNTIALRDLDASAFDQATRILLRGINERTDLHNEVRALCGGDPYVIGRIGRQVRAARNKLSDQNTEADAINAVRNVIARARANPVETAPLFERYGEWLEQDVDALELAIGIDSGRHLEHVANLALDDNQVAPLWHGFFKQQDGAWTFRSGLAHAYFKRHFLEQPARVVECYIRHQKYESAVRFLDAARDYAPNQLNVLETIALAWVRDANTPSLAWNAIAKLLQLWLGNAVRVYRFYARSQSAARQPDSYYRVVPDGLETRADPSTEALLRDAHRERTADPGAARQDIARWPVAIDEGRQQWAFMLTNNAREYGALIWDAATYKRESESQRALNFWTRLFNSIFREIARFEDDVVSNIDIARIQSIAQENRDPEMTDGVLRVILTAITARQGLQFHRAVLLQAMGDNHLRGRVAVGHHSMSDARAAWDVLHTVNADVLKLNAAQLSNPPDAERTPLDREAARFSLTHWRNDPLLARALSSDTPLLASRAQIATQPDSALARLLRIENAAGIADDDKPLIIAPIREGAARQLAGVLIVDRPFDNERITQEQVDRLPQFAAQLGLVLQNEDNLRRRALFDQLGAFGTKALSLQETLELIARAVLAHFGGRLKQIMISIWETSNAKDEDRPNRRVSTLRIALREGQIDMLAEGWQYAYYDDASPFAVHTSRAGCVDGVLFQKTGTLHIRDLASWHGEHGPSKPEALFDGIGSVFSVALASEDQGTPRGVISFQSGLTDAFSNGDGELFKQIAQRAASVIEKARSFEGLTRARRNTRQLNKAMSDLLKQSTNVALYAKILARAQDLFTADLLSLDGQRRADSAVLLAMENNEIAFRLDGRKSALAEQLAHTCNLMRKQTTRAGSRPLYVEHASRELVARERFGDDECNRHAALGAEASVWTMVGKASDMMLVLAWKKPRRMNNTERAALPLFCEIAARTNGVIERERELMRKQLESSLNVDDYAMIEAEFTHRWNKRVRAMRQNAQYARELLDEAADVALDARKLEELRGYLSRIESVGKESIERMGAVESLRRTEPVAFKRWLSDQVRRWNTLNPPESGDPPCAFESTLTDDQKIVTRPVILTWILHEFLINARQADRPLPQAERRLLIEAGYDRVRRGFEISISNAKPIPREELEAMRSKTPLKRANNSGRGVWIAGGQVQTLLGGVLSLPGTEDSSTRFTIFLPEKPKLTE